MNNRSDRKLKSLFIDIGLQSKVIVTSMLYMILVLVVTIFVILFPVINEMYSSTDLNVKYKAAQTFLLLAKNLLPGTITLFAFFFLHLIIITHRICGPLVNFRNTFSRIATGDLTRKVRLRKGDYLVRECNQINEMIEGLSSHIYTVRSNHDKMISILEEALDSVEDLNTRNKIEQILDEVKGEALAVKGDLLNFIIDESEK